MKPPLAKVFFGIYARFLESLSDGVLACSCRRSEKRAESAQSAAILRRYHGTRCSSELLDGGGIVEQIVSAAE